MLPGRDEIIKIITTYLVKFQAPCTQFKLEKEFKLETKNVWKSTIYRKLKILIKKPKRSLITNY